MKICTYKGKVHNLTLSKGGHLCDGFKTVDQTVECV